MCSCVLADNASNDPTENLPASRWQATQRCALTGSALDRSTRDLQNARFGQVVDPVGIKVADVYVSEVSCALGDIERRPDVIDGELRCPVPLAGPLDATDSRPEMFEPSSFVHLKENA